jgi:hypothetical protein
LDFHCPISKYSYLGATWFWNRKVQSIVQRS